MYGKILVPLDGSPLAEQVLPYVRLVAKALKAKVELLQVLGPVAPDLVDPAHGIYLDKILAGMRGQAGAYLDKVGASLRKAGLSVSTDVHEGNPAEYIISGAAREKDTLIAMTTHGRSGIARWVLGSVTEKVLNAASNPLLVVRARKKPTPPNQVRLDVAILPLDGSLLAEQALPHVAALANAMSMKIKLVRVTPFAQDLYMYTDYPIGKYADVQEDTLKSIDVEAEKYLRNQTKKLQRQGVSSVEHVLLHGNPADAIVDVARGTEDNLVVMTTHGRSGIGRFLLGSVADRVVRYCGDPVLIVRASAASKGAQKGGR